MGADVPGHSAAAFVGAGHGGDLRSPWQPAGSTNLDGLLGTGTYIVVPGETESDAARADDRPVRRRRCGRRPVHAAAAAGVTPYQAITVASIVQKEAISPGDSATATADNVGPVAG